MILVIIIIIIIIIIVFISKTISHSYNIANIFTKANKCSKALRLIIDLIDIFFMNIDLKRLIWTRGKINSRPCCEVLSCFRWQEVKKSGLVVSNPTP